MRVAIAFIGMMVFVAIAQCASAQALPDTSLNRVIPDTLPARNAPVLAKPGPEQAAYDSLRGKVKPFQPDPKKSALYSSILPGAGQIYNRQYWKAPVIYAGMAVSFYFLIDNSRQYQRFRRGYIARINNANVNDEFTGLRTQGELQILQNAYKKYLDMTILFTGLGYTIQVLDALAFAHLRNFDVTKDISMKVQPVAMPNGDPGVGLLVRF